MEAIKNVLADPAVIVGLVRASLILVVSFGVAITQEQTDALLAFTGAVLAVLSIVLTSVTYANTNPKADSVLVADLPQSAIDAMADDVPAD